MAELFHLKKTTQQLNIRIRDLLKNKLPLTDAVTNRYSIIGASVEQIKNAGGTDIIEAPRVGVIFATLDEKGVAYLKSIGARVSSVKEVKTSQIAPPYPVSPAVTGYTPKQLMEAIGFTEDWRYMSDPPLFGEGFAVAVVDSGIRDTHELISGRVVYKANFFGEPGYGFDHGTGVASIVLAVAPKCDILDIKVLNEQGVGSDETVTLGIEEVLNICDTRKDIVPVAINLSLGEPDEADPNDSVRVACRAAIARGIFVMAAAGNSGPGPMTILSPACERYVAAVGSFKFNPDDPQYPYLVSDFSSRGPTLEGLIKPDFLAPGENVIVASNLNDVATITRSGTSYAAPFASGAAALYFEGISRQARLKPEYAFSGIPMTAFPVTVEEAGDYWLPLMCIKPNTAPPGKDNAYGWGIPYGRQLMNFLVSLVGTQQATQITQLVSAFLCFGLITSTVTSVVKESQR